MNKLTRRQAAIIGTYTGITAGPFEDVQGYIEELVGHPVWTHELASKTFVDHVKELAKPDFIAICASRENSDE